MSLTKRFLLSLGVLGVLAAGLGGGTFATFSAQTENAATFAGGTVAMTNVAGTVVSGSDCATETTAGTCAAIFSATAMKPGAADLSNTVTITYTGTMSTGDFRLYASGFETKAAGSSALCSATDPASKLNVQVKQGSTIVYPTGGTGYGTLAGFASAYSSAANGLQLKGEAGTAGVWAQDDAAVFTINVNLDGTADNPYQGCQSLATLVWSAAQ
jgi:hypothetical protein